jgi:hypothetical protein
MTRIFQIFLEDRNFLVLFCPFLMFFHLEDLFFIGILRMKRISILTRTNPRENEDMACLYEITIKALLLPEIHQLSHSKLSFNFNYFYFQFKELSTTKFSQPDFVLFLLFCYSFTAMNLMKPKTCSRFTVFNASSGIDFRNVLVGVDSRLEGCPECLDNVA